MVQNPPFPFSLLLLRSVLLVGVVLRRLLAASARMHTQRYNTGGHSRDFLHARAHFLSMSQAVLHILLIGQVPNRVD